MPTNKIDKSKQDLEAVLDKIAGFPEPYSTIAKQLHEAILSVEPRLKPRIWYGMPGYATGRSKPVLVFFRCDDGVFSFGLTEKAKVEGESGSMLRPCAWYLDEVDDATLERVTDLARTATG
ncbi:MAG: hypothetical protein WBW62_10855 [Solirubrobacterales bacterium]